MEYRKSLIISHKHKFIFVKTRKTAGTSIEDTLSKICGDDDIITKDHLHSGEHDNLHEVARNYSGLYNPIPDIILNDSLFDAVRSVRDFIQRPKYYNHMAARSIKNRIRPDIWREYYKFCFERNPWDKIVSYYFWRFRHQRENIPEFNETILNWRNYGTLDQAFPTDWKRYTMKDRVIVDDVFIYDDVEYSLKSALIKAGVDTRVVENLVLGKLKSEHRKPRHSVQYNKESISIIQNIFSKEINYFKFPRDTV